MTSYTNPVNHELYENAKNIEYALLLLHNHDYVPLVATGSSYANSHVT